MSLLFILGEMVIYLVSDTWTKNELFLYSLLNFIVCSILTVIVDLSKGTKR